MCVRNTKYWPFPLERVPKPQLSQFGKAQFGVETGFCQETVKERLRNASRADPGNRWDSLELGCAEWLCHLPKLLVREDFSGRRVGFVEKSLSSHP